METMGERADKLFNLSERSIEAGLKAMLAEHSAKGLLQSGVTIKRSVTIYGEHTGLALVSALDSISKRTEHRGRKWKSMLGEIEVALERHLVRAVPLLERSVKIASSDGIELAAPLIADVASNLRDQISSYREGWTAPPGKSWIERHPVIYAVLLLVAGIVIGQAIEVAAKMAIASNIER